MSSSEKNEARKQTKLSLTKKSRKVKKEPTEQEVQNVLPVGVDLNETCEFKEPMTFGGVGASRKRGREKEVSRATSSASRSDDTGDHAVVPGFCEEEEVLCQVCNKNLGHMNSQRRLQHVNKCIDKTEEKDALVRQEQQQLDAAKTAVLNCPMCGKNFKSKNARHTHLKKCSKTLGVARDTMVKLLKDQEDERQTMVAAGVVPTSVRPTNLKAAAPSKKRKIKEPKSQYEEDVQVAIAISSSLVEPQQSDSSHMIGEKLTSSAANKGKTSRRNKKTVLEDVCLLTTLTDADRQRRMAEKVNTILIQEEFGKDGVIQTLPPLFESVLHASETSPPSSRSLWTRSNQLANGGDITLFYTESLMPPISVSRAVTGSKLRRMSAIPGRDSSFVRERSFTEEKTVEQSALSGDEITVSTQTAVILAELAVDDDDLNGSVVGEGIRPSQDSYGMEVLQASGFCVQKLILKKEDQDEMQSQTLQAYKQLINSRDYSDVTITTADGLTLHAHTVILAARCPKLLQLLKDSDMQLDVSADAALSLLNYLYTGELTLTPSAHTELTSLSDQLELSALKSACSRLVSVEESSENVCTSPEKKKEDASSDKEEFLKSMLDMKEIFGESSDSDSDDDVDRKEGTDSDMGFQRKEEDEIGNDEYRDIMCTQRQRIRKQTDSEDADKSGIMGDLVESVDIDDEANIDSEDTETKNTESCAVDITCDDYDSKDEDIETKTKDIKGVDNTDTVGGLNDGDNQKMEEGVECIEILSEESSDSEQSDNMATDGESFPRPKRIRLSSEKECLDIGEVKGQISDETRRAADVVTEKEKMKGNAINASFGQRNSVSLSSSETEENRELITSFLCDKETIKVMDASTASMNSSSADLFGSPSPVKQRHITVHKPEHLETPIPGTSGILSSSTPILHQSPTFRKSFKQALHNDSLFITPVPNLKERRSYQFETPENKPEISDLTDNKESCAMNNLIKCKSRPSSLTFDAKDTSDEHEANTSSQDSNKKKSIELSKSSSETKEIITNEEDDDDDLEITGDNFDEISQRSPTFSVDSKTRNLAKSRMNDGTDNVGVDTDNALEDYKVDIIDMTDEDINHCFDESFNDMEGVVNMEMEESNGIQTNNTGQMELNSASDNSSNDVCGTERKIESRAYGKLDVDTGSKPEHEQEVEADSEDEVVEIKSDSSTCGEMAADTGELTGEVSVESKPRFYGKHDISNYEDEGDEYRSDAVNDADMNMEYAQDVWEDFDDCGMDYVPPVTSPGLSSPPDACNKHDDTLTSDPDPGIDSTFLQEGDDSFVFNVDDDPTSDMHVQPASGSKEQNFKTPTMNKGRAKKKRPWVAPSPFTPKPEYDKMATPVLKKAVQKFGVKAVGKKRMIKLLDDVYHQTHQYETDSEYEDETQKDTQISIDRRTNTQASGDGDDGLEISQESVSSQESEISELFEESCLHPPSSDSDASSSPQKSVDVNKRLFDYFKRNRDLNIRVLMYEPLELDVLKKDLKESGIKCSMDKLMNFLDERCIAFTNKNTRKRATSKRGKKKNTAKEAKTKT